MKKESLGAIVLGAILFTAWLCLTFAHPLAHWPGDTGDSRFNLYVLEHGYRFFTGQDASFWNAPIFYPAPLATAFSDAHLGTLPLYIFWRVLGFDREHAGALWLYTCFALDFIAACWALRRFRFSRIAALLGGYFFAFGLPVMAQLFRSQLIPRFWVPVAFVAFARYLETGRGRALALTTAAVALQFYATIYIGYFLVFALAAYFLAGRIIGEHFVAGRSMGELDRAPRLGPLLAAGAMGALLLLPLAMPYAQVAAWLGERSYREIGTQIPHLYFYLQASPWSVAWGRLCRATAWSLSQSCIWEHYLFLGFVPLAAIGAGVARRWRDPHTGLPDLRAWRFFLCGAILFLATLMIGKWSFYEILTPLPGIAAMRAIARVMLVMIFPCSVLLAWEVDALLTSIGNRRMALGMAVVFSLLLVTDQWTRLPNLSYAALAERTAPYDRLLAADAHQHKVFAFVPSAHLIDTPVGEDPEGVNPQILDVMLATQRAGYLTLNGYSGNHPNGYPAGLLYGIREPSQNQAEAALCLSRWISCMPLVFTREELLLPPGIPFLPPDHALPLPGQGFQEFFLSPKDGAIHIGTAERRAEFLIPARRQNVGKRARLIFTLTAPTPATLTIQTGAVRQVIQIRDSSQEIPVDLEFPIETTLDKISFSVDSDSAHRDPTWPTFSLHGIVLSLVSN